jgi:glyoxylase-like metal-dependent hydrolase (beta-lactamase superfamily II)/rhodanese-related sulfurtransferase
MAGVPQVPEITCEELIRTIESGEPIRVLDIRAPAVLFGGRIDLLPPERFLNIRGSEILSLGEAVGSELPMDGPIAVVCGHGNSSKQIAVHLNELGYRARSLRGGMAAWSDALAPRPLERPPGFDHLVQFDRVAKGALGYLVAAGGEAFVIDPPRKLQPYFDLAREWGVKIVGVADTHIHADYLSGGPAISRSLDVPYYIHPADGVSPYDGTPAKVPYTPLAHGQTLQVGPAEIRVEHTPGHTEGSVCYWLGDRAVLTGDFLFVRSVGRPDLGGKLDEWTPVLWKSIEQARRSWPSEARVHPAHYGSPLEREPDRSVGRSFGSLSEVNEPLRMGAESEFVAWVKRKVGSVPDAYRKIKTVNLGLLQIWEMEAQELESGKNECALG